MYDFIVYFFLQCYSVPSLLGIYMQNVLFYLTKEATRVWFCDTFLLQIFFYILFKQLILLQWLNHTIACFWRWSYCLLKKIYFLIDIENKFLFVKIDFSKFKWEYLIEVPKGGKTFVTVQLTSENKNTYTLSKKSIDFH